jgi:non-ribosomal peptide synthetase component F
MIEQGTQTIWQAFAATAGLYQDRPVFNIMAETAGIYGIEPGEVSYRQVQEQVTELAAALQQKGYGPGFRVMLLLENRPQFFPLAAGAQPDRRLGGSGQSGSQAFRTHLYGRPFRALPDYRACEPLR